jgi:hypothetical protein
MRMSARLTTTLAAVALLLGCGSSTTSNANGGGSGGAGGDTASNVAADGYITTGPWAGYGFTATDPGAATITPNCAAAGGCTPAFAGNIFCMHGTVTGRADYTGFAMLGWNLNQASTAGAVADTWAVPASGGLTVTVANKPATTALRVQLQGTNPHDSADRWCAALDNGKTIAWGDFKTNCWQGGSPQNPLSAGTLLQQGAILVPGLLTELPFDVCLVDVKLEP